MENEIWKDVKNYEGLYQVSNFGRIKSLGRWVSYKGRSDVFKPEKILKINRCYDYETVMLYKQGKGIRKYIHRLVAESFVENLGNKSEVNHKDGKKQNNYFSNLEWVSRKENVAHAIEKGLSDSKGSANQMSVLTESEVLKIRSMAKIGRHSRKEIAAFFGIKKYHVEQIVNRRRWKHL